MRHLKMIGLAAVAVMAMMAVVAGHASATTLEVGGVSQSSSVAPDLSLKAGSTLLLEMTDGTPILTCFTSTIGGKTESPYSGTTVGGKTVVSFSSCGHSATVDSGGSLTFEHITGTTNGTVRSTGMSVTVQSTTFGATLNCTTNNTHLGTLAGVASGHASLKVNAVVNCGFFAPTTKWTGDYTITTPTGLGVVA
jgi:hypothetical protein